MLYIFDDARSLVHVLCGLAAGVLCNLYLSSAIFLAFALYQALEEEPKASKAGDFAEFAVGAAIGLAIRLLFAGPPL